jgi:hypothetical protein
LCRYREVAPQLEHVSDCVDVDAHTAAFHVKVYIPRVDASTNPKTESEKVLPLFKPEAFEHAFGGAADDAVKVTSVKTSEVTIHGEITVKMPPVDGSEKHFGGAA